MEDKTNLWFQKNQYIVLAFFFPFFILTLAYMAMWFTPFGDLSLIVSDMNAQYIDMFSAYRDVIHGDRSIFYTWSQIQGCNMFVLMISYIIRPLNFIAVILPEDHLVDAITIITLLKVGFAGASFAWYLRKTYDKNDISLVVFASCYALMGYNIIFALNIFWLDLVILLPFVIRGVDLIIEDTRKFLLFTLSLIVIFSTDYYISYMIGIFAFAYFIYKYLCINEKTAIKPFFMKLAVFFGSTILAALCSAWILLPNYYSLGIGTRKGFLEPEKFKISLEYDFLTIFTKLFIGSFDTIGYGGVANIYCGLIVTLLVLLYFANKQIRFKEKILSLLMIIFFWASSVISILYLAWHLFASPHFFEARFSFVICFFMIVIAYNSYLKINDVSAKNINYIFLAVASIVILIDRMNYSYITDVVVIATLIFLLLYYLFFIIMQKKEEARKYYKLIFVALVCTELCLNTNMTILNMNEVLKYPNKYDYYEEIGKIKQDIYQITENDKHFYRIEKDFLRSENDGINIGYPCIVMFASSYNESTKEQMKHLGVKTGHNWISYKGFTAVTDALFNIKYVILKNSEAPIYELVSKKEDRHIYKNPYALSVGYMVGDDLNDLYNTEEIKIENPFLYQNQLLTHMLGESAEDYFKPVEIQKVHLENMGEAEKEYAQKNAKLLNAEKIPMTMYYRKDNNQESYIEYEIEAKKGPLYLYLPTKIVVPMYIQIQEKEKQVYFDLDSNHIVYLGTYEEGEKVRVKLIHGGQDILLQDTLFYYLDTDLFTQAVNRLSKNILWVEEYSDDFIKGTITVEDRHVLFTSIPYDEGWHIKVNGTEHKPIKVMNGFVGLELPDSGIYQLEFNYMPKGLIPGSMISAAGIVLLIIISIFENLRYKVKNERKESISQFNE